MIFLTTEYLYILLLAEIGCLLTGNQGISAQIKFLIFTKRKQCRLVLVVFWFFFVGMAQKNPF